MDEETREVIKVHQTKFGRFRIETDGGMTTRANIPFMDPPPPPAYLPLQTLSVEIQEMVNVVRAFNEPEAISAMRRLVQPYIDVMSNLPGGVHNCGEKTLVELVKKLQLDPLESVLFECGSGAPLLGLQASLFTKQTICIDLDDVMKTVYSIIDTMTDKTSLIKTIHLISGIIHLVFFVHNPLILGDILEMRPTIFGRINKNLGYGNDRSILDEVTHVTAFIGIDSGKLMFSFYLTKKIVNEALVKFSLKYLKSLKFLSFRGELDTNLKTLLSQFGFEEDNDLGFPLILRGSGLFLFI